MEELTTEQLVEERTKDYGHPAEFFTHVARTWSALLGLEIKPTDIPLMMIVYKLVREKKNPKQDNRDDIKGYAHTIDMYYKKIL